MVALDPMTNYFDLLLTFFVTLGFYYFVKSYFFHAMSWFEVKNSVVNFLIDFLIQN